MLNDGKPRSSRSSCPDYVNDFNVNDTVHICDFWNRQTTRKTHNQDLYYPLSFRSDGIGASAQMELQDNYIHPIWTMVEEIETKAKLDINTVSGYECVHFAPVYVGWLDVLRQFCLLLLSFRLSRSVLAAQSRPFVAAVWLPIFQWIQCDPDW